MRSLASDELPHRMNGLLAHSADMHVPTPIPSLLTYEPFPPPTEGPDAVNVYVDPTPGAPTDEPPPTPTLEISYADAQWELHLVDSHPNYSDVEKAKGWFRLLPYVKHPLRFGDTVIIGDLKFEVHGFYTSAASAQGYRNSMEDREAIVQDIPLCRVNRGVPISFYAVYDGHGGSGCADFASNVLHNVLRRELCGFDMLSPGSHAHIYHSLYRSFVLTDLAYLRSEQLAARPLGSGCVAVVVLMIGEAIWCANCGDARAVLSRDGQAVQLSADQRPDRVDESLRIHRSGGFVRNKRILGRLAVSRALGDSEYKFVGTKKPPLVIADPEIRWVPVSVSHEFLLIACDGLFDVFTSQEAISFVRHRLVVQKIRPELVAEEIVREAIEVRKSRDNVTAVVVLLNWRK
eukprot:GHVO01014257.1.p1 GENE.GHVO01014257.1~~GHVO01014257.1.p1  ORF type:complete len:404 (-),score=70.62 GHVO01014257.1:531-1742(-)